MIYSRNQKYWALIILSSISFLALLIFLIQITIAGEPSTIEDFPWYFFARSVLLSSPFLMGVAYMDYKMVKFVNADKWLLSHLFLRLLLELILIVVFSLIFIILGNIPFYYEIDPGTFFKELFYNGSVVAAILLNIFMVVVIEFFVQNRKSQTLQQENARMQYRQLKSQINPHFLFNSLNVLVSLINKDTQRATDYTKKLSDVYRYVLTYDVEDVVSVHDELEFIRNYIEILRIRYGDGLQIQFTVIPADLQKAIPPMSLQVLVENAVKHNALSPAEPLCLQITSDSSYIIVSNNIIPRLRVESSMGIGLENLKEKYHIIANKNIMTERTTGEFIVKLPLL